MTVIPPLCFVLHIGIISFVNTQLQTELWDSTDLFRHASTGGNQIVLGWNKKMPEEI